MRLGGNVRAPRHRHVVAQLPEAVHGGKERPLPRVVRGAHAHDGKVSRGNDESILPEEVRRPVGSLHGHVPQVLARGLDAHPRADVPKVAARLRLELGEEVVHQCHAQDLSALFIPLVCVAIGWEVDALKGLHEVSHVLPIAAQRVGAALVPRRGGGGFVIARVRQVHLHGDVSTPLGLEQVQVLDAAVRLLLPELGVQLLHLLRREPRALLPQLGLVHREVLPHGLVVQQVEAVVLVEGVDGTHALARGPRGDDGLRAVDGPQLAADARLVRQLHRCDVPARAERVGQLRIVLPRRVVPRRCERRQLAAINQLAPELPGLEVLHHGCHPLSRVTHLHVVVLSVVAGQGPVVAESGLGGEGVLELDPRTKWREDEAVADVAQSLRDAGAVVIPIEAPAALLFLGSLAAGSARAAEEGGLVFDGLVSLLDQV
mmetsp:Transcript_55482/g.117981  ORF Transcript_55482/g.117981 Transcript_55482/m.117981 type:complete len:431 (+) Transcript_55482:2676-3968(+)